MGGQGRKTRPGPGPIFLQACVPALCKCGGGWIKGKAAQLAQATPGEGQKKAEYGKREE